MGDVVPYVKTPLIPSLNLSSLPHLEHLTIRVGVYCDLGDNFFSCLPAAAEILKTASLLHVTIDIWIDSNIGSLSNINFLPLTALAESSASFRHIDFYIHSRMEITHSEVVSLLARYEGLRKLIERRVLVIHVQETAPKDPQFAL
jgi:hypothetical protein